MRKLFAILTLILCLPFAGCDDESAWNLPDLGRNSITVSPTEGTSISIASGSGDYSASVDDPTVAKVRVELAYGAHPQLFIEPLKEGEAQITVTDKKSGHKAILALKVAKYNSTIKIADIEFSVDADHPEAIEAELKADTSVPPIGGAILLSIWNSPPEWAFADADGDGFAHGSLKREELTDGNGNPIFGPLLPAVQLKGWEKWTLFYEEGARREFSLYIMDRPTTRANLSLIRPSQYRFFEDLTEYYKAKFPDAGVKSVVRVLISNGTN